MGELSSVIAGAAPRFFLSLGILLLASGSLFADEEFERDVRPILKTHCFSCHGMRTQKGKLDLERFVQPAQGLSDLKTWQGVAAKISEGEMPPRGKPPLQETERTSIARWVAGLVEKAEAAEPTDPGPTFPRRITRRE